MSDGIGIDGRGPGYIARAPDGTFRLVPIADPWAAPALARVPIDTSNTVSAAMSLFAWLAHPKLDQYDEKRRARAYDALAAWHWRSLNHFDHCQKKDMPRFAKAIREDRVLPAVKKITGHVLKRLTASQIFMWIALAEGGVNATVRGKRPTAKALSNAIARPIGETQAEDARKRIWLQSRPVLHVADAMRLLISRIDDQGDLWGRLLVRTDWVPSLLDDAEIRRRMILPTTSVPPEHTIQFRPIG